MTYPQQPPYPPTPPQPPRKGRPGLTIAASIAGGFVAVAALLALVDTDTPPSADDKPTPAAAEPATNPEQLDDRGQAACDTFAHGYSENMTEQQRLDLAHDVNADARHSDSRGITDNGKVLANGATGSAGSWQLAADTFAATCLDRGWTA